MLRLLLRLLLLLIRLRLHLTASLTASPAATLFTQMPSGYGAHERSRRRGLLEVRRQ